MKQCKHRYSQRRYLVFIIHCVRHIKHKLQPWHWWYCMILYWMKDEVDLAQTSPKYYKRKSHKAIDELFSNNPKWFCVISIWVVKVCRKQVSGLFACRSSVQGVSGKAASLAREGHRCSCFKEVWKTFVAYVVDEPLSLECVRHNLGRQRIRAWFGLTFAHNNHTWQAKAMIFSTMTERGPYHLLRLECTMSALQ